MNAPPWFKILKSHKGNDFRLPGAVPWTLVAPHEAQAQRNHAQTLARLDERGGLAIQELWCVCHDKTWNDRAEQEDAVQWLLALMWNRVCVDTTS